eukprot:NODE_1021_length_1613_cov_6.009591_g844_i0.p1 GENE.NODE_1021_length_1613_cov_6.009591_g844_i0~~NODE_1021_length_1613_cov_6.009591_g844_i0.p1  ORF type:complete len:518 (+),score=118.57 NODE_1021_length_1613_cov_6.009591_g844_i0:177-1556(+)
MIAAAHEAAGSGKNVSKEIKAAAQKDTNLTVEALKAFVAAVCRKPTVDGLAERNVWVTLTKSDSYAFELMSVLDDFLNDEVVDEEDDSAREKIANKSISYDKRKKASPPGSRVKTLYEFIAPYAQKHFDCQRVVATGFLGELLWHSLQDHDLVSQILNCLLARAGADECFHVTLLALDGLGGIVGHDHSEISAFVPPCIHKLSSFFHDKKDEVGLKAMETLDRIIRDVDGPAALNSSIVNILGDVKPFFTSENNPKRLAVFTLLDALIAGANLGRLDVRTIDIQVWQYLALLLVHVNEEDLELRKQVKTTLQTFVTFVSTKSADTKFADRLVVLFQKPALQPEKRIPEYDDFASDFCKIWVSDFSPRVADLVMGLLSFLKSSFGFARSAGCIFLGYLMHHLPENDRKRASAENCVANLIATIRKEPKTQVRQKAAKALGLVSTHYHEVPNSSFDSPNSP